MAAASSPSPLRHDCLALRRLEHRTRLVSLDSYLDASCLIGRHSRDSMCSNMVIRALHQLGQKAFVFNSSTFPMPCGYFATSKSKPPYSRHNPVPSATILGTNSLLGLPTSFPKTDSTSLRASPWKDSLFHMYYLSPSDQRLWLQAVQNSHTRGSHITQQELTQMQDSFSLWLHPDS